MSSLDTFVKFDVISVLDTHGKFGLTQVKIEIIVAGVPAGCLGRVGRREISK